MAEPARLSDITLPFSERLPVWPGDAPVRIARTTAFVTISELSMSSHAGSHLDAPAHFIPQGRTVDQLDLATLIGPAWVCDCTGVSVITAEALDRSRIPEGVQRLLFRTINSERPWLDSDEEPAGGGQIPFNTGFVALDESAARWLLTRDIKLVGVDGPSVDLYESDFAVHRLLLGHDVIVVENLHLHGVRPGAYRLICLPLPYEGGDGAPVRAVLETI